MSEPKNVDVRFDMDNNGFSPRYSIYLKELHKKLLYQKEKVCL